MNLQRARVLTACVLWCVIGLSGCTTPYQQTGFQGGYSQEQISDDTFWVSFDGNTSLDAKALEQSLLRTAAEMTRQHGFTHFVVVNREQQASAGFVFKPGLVGPVRQTAKSIMIKCYTGDPHLDGAIDAESFLRAQGAKPAKQHKPATL